MLQHFQVGEGLGRRRQLVHFVASRFTGTAAHAAGDIMQYSQVAGITGKMIRGSGVGGFGDRGTDTGRAHPAQEFSS